MEHDLPVAFFAVSPIPFGRVPDMFFLDIGILITVAI